jgi:hypothetical protein
LEQLLPPVARLGAKVLRTFPNSGLILEGTIHWFDSMDGLYIILYSNGQEEFIGWHDVPKTFDLLPDVLVWFALSFLESCNRLEFQTVSKSQTCD